MLKQIVLGSAILAAIAATAFAETRKPANRLEIDTKIRIAAPPEAVWATLSDLEGYPDWNPYHVRVDGTLAEGEKLTVHIQKPNGHALRVRPRVIEIDTGKSLVWGGGIPGLFQGKHRFDLTPDGPSCTELRHSEVFSGLFVRYAELDAIEPGYKQMNAALKSRLETAGASGC